MRKCCFCKKEYRTYPVLLNDSIEGYLIEEHIKEIYYSEEKEEGVCKECRKKEFEENPVWKIRTWLSVRYQLQLGLDHAEKENNPKKCQTIKEALERISKYEKALEETPEVKALYLKNNPAGCKTEPPTGKCIYCDENDAKEWINDPNEPNPKIENCWGVCFPCRKIIERQSEASYLINVNNMLKDKGIDTKGAGKERIKQLKKEIQEIAREDCQEVSSCSITKNKDGTIDIKKEY